MHWSDAIAKPTDRKLREFAAAATVFCGALALWRVFSGNIALAGALAGFAVLAAMLGSWKPRWLAPFFTTAMVLTFPLAWLVSLLVLAVVFYGLLTPLGLLFRLLGRDALNRRLRPNQSTYWQDKPAADHPQRYLRQY